MELKAQRRYNNLVWLTDVHLDCLSDSKVMAFARRLQAEVVRLGELETAVIITGDISTCSSLRHHLALLRPTGPRKPGGLQAPPYFVLGNHDFWKGTFEESYRQARGITEKGIATWLTEHSPIRLNDTTTLTGVDGIYDARVGNPLSDRIQMNCWQRILDFRGLDREAIVRLVRGMGERLARMAKDKLLEAISLTPEGGRVVFATHYPPFEEAHIYRGEIGDAASQPWYTWIALGDVLREVSTQHPNHRFLVLAGHTHGHANVFPLPNLQVRVGQAEYGKPWIADVISLE